VEVAFFFPWAVVFGTTNTVRNTLAGSEAGVRDKLEKYAEIDAGAESAKLFRARAAKEADFVVQKQKLKDSFAKNPELADNPIKELEKQHRKDLDRIDKQINANYAKWEGEKNRIKNAGDSDLRAELSQRMYQRELKVALPPLPDQPADSQRITAEAARSWSWYIFLDIFVFFGVLMVGFAYLWRRGDIDWVRAVTPSASVRPSTVALQPSPHESELATVHSKV
jgi:hypothetical protein